MIEHIDKEESQKRAEKVFEIAKRKSKFYQNKYANVAKWSEIPFLTRDELYRHTFPKSKDMLTQEIQGMVITSTGGSSGMARYGVLTYNELNEFENIQAESLKLIGINEDDIIANLFLAGNLWPSFFVVANVAEKIGATHLPISGNIDIKKILDYIMEFKATALLSLPTIFVFLADLILKESLDAGFVKTIAYAGEHMSDMIKGHLKKAFPNANIEALGYTSADCGLMGYQCSECDSLEYHVPMAFQYLEIYDFENEILCENGESGEIVVTNLARTSLPIIRYRIGDVGRFKTTPCKCNDKNPILILEGRAGEDFKIGGAYISMDSVESAIKDFVSTDGISANYQFIIEDIYDNKMKITLKIESFDVEKSKQHIEEIKNNLQEEISDIKVGREIGYITIEVLFVNIGELDRNPITDKIIHFKDLRIGG